MFQSLRIPSPPQEPQERPASTGRPTDSTTLWNALSKPAAAMSAAAALFVGEAKVNAGLTPDGVDPNISLNAARSLPSKGALHFKYEYDDETAPGGRRTKYAGAVLGQDKRVAFTCAHVIDGGLLDKNLKAWVGTCTNYNDQGPWYEVKSFHMFPGYVDDGSRSFTADIAALPLLEEVTTAIPPTIASEPVVDTQNVLYCGSGAWGTPNTGLRPRDGDIRAGTSTARPGSLAGESTEYYQTTRFYNQPSNITGLRPTPGYSGWPVFTADGDAAVGLAAYANTGVLGSAAGYLKLTHPKVKEFMDSFTGSPPTITPELRIYRTELGIELQWNVAPGWRLQSSESLTEGTWTNVDLPLSPSSASTNAVFIPEEQLNGRGFFRLAR